MIPFITKLPVKSIKKYEIISCILACLLGIFFHFLYDLSGKNFILGFFIPVNESIWEHLKLIFYPIVIVSIVEYYFFNIKCEGFFKIKLISVILGMTLTVVLYYTYSGIIGREFDYINIGIYFIAMILSYIYSYNKQKKEDICQSSSCLLIFGIIMIAFAYLTVFPLPIEIFNPYA